MVAVLDIGNLKIVTGDIHEADISATGGPVDLGDTFFNVMEPSVGFDIHASAVAALQSRLVGTGVAAGPEVDELERSLRQAASAEDGWLASSLMLDLTLRKRSARNPGSGPVGVRSSRE